MVGKVYAVMMLILVVSISSANAQDEIYSLSDEYDLDYYLLPEIGLLGELRELEFGLSLEESWTDQSICCGLCEMLLWLCLELEVTDEETDEIFPGLWELDYEFYPLWEDDLSIY